MQSNRQRIIVAWPSEGKMERNNNIVVVVNVHSADGWTQCIEPAVRQPASLYPSIQQHLMITNEFASIALHGVFVKTIVCRVASPQSSTIASNKSLKHTHTHLRSHRTRQRVRAPSTQFMVIFNGPLWFVGDPSSTYISNSICSVQCNAVDRSLSSATLFELS